MSSISALGDEPSNIWTAYLDMDSYIIRKNIGNSETWVGSLNDEVRSKIEDLRYSDSKYKKLDDSVLYGIYTARKAVALAGWKAEDNFGINFGSSRGATQLFEKYHEEFLESKQSSTLTSPTTTLGNISSWIAHDLRTQGPEISHSITCSTALHSLLNGIAWIQSGLTNKFLVGGTEASLTEFTLAQMKAMKIYSKETDSFPCKSLDFSKSKNTMVIGEGASCVCIEQGDHSKALAKIEGMGYATEILEHNTSISAEAECFQKSMKMAIENMDPSQIDVVVMHAPGTIKGDHSEYKALQKVFGTSLPFVTSNKWKIGHTFGASGMLSLELAVLMLHNQMAVGVPFVLDQEKPKSIRKVLVNAVGFGGNAVSILLSR